MQAYSFTKSLNESIYFDYAPVPTFSGHLNRYPFRIVISSSNNNPHIVDLNVKFSKSYKPKENPSKWSFLRPETKFFDLNGKQINSITTTDTNLYIDSNGVVNTVTGNFIGVSGFAEFYFSDDIYNYDFVIDNKPYTTIVAILQTSGINYFDYDKSKHILTTDYSNSQAIAYQPHIFHYRDPDYIKIKENGIRDFINPRWVASNQHVVFTFNWNQNYETLYYEGNEIQPINFVTNFNKNLPSNTNQDDIVISSASNDIKVYYTKQPTLNYLDQNGYLTPGYSKTFFNVATSTNMMQISAQATFNTPNLKGNLYSPKLWLSNPNAGLMSVVEYNFPTTFGLASTALLKANIFNFEVPIVYNPNYRQESNSEIYYDEFAFSGFHSIQSIAVLPAPSFQAWAIDGELNYLYKFGTNGQILSSIDLYNIANADGNLNAPFIDKQVSPNSIVLDGELNMFITLYDNTYVLEFDKNGNYFGALDLSQIWRSTGVPLSANNINENWFYDNQPYPDVIQNQNFIEPTYIDTDSQNYIWVTYSNYASGYLAKFDRNNNLYSTVSYPVCSCPQDLIVDNQDQVWVALSNNIWDSIGSIEKRDTNGNLLSSFGPIMGVNNLTLDLDQNLWFTYSYSKIGRIDNITGDILTFNILDNSDASKYAPYNQTNPTENTSETALEGIGCDLKGYLYVVNSVENRIYIYNTKTLEYVDNFYVNPQGFVFWNKSGLSADTSIEYNQWNKSLQAYGDWIGTRWINKYYDYSTRTVSITGISRELSFLPVKSIKRSNEISFLASTFYKYIQTDKLEKLKVTPSTSVNPISTNWILDFFKVNENFDLASYVKSYAFTPSLIDSVYLFDVFLPSIYGIYPYFHDDMGVKIYEKISNFIPNTTDIDTCQIDNLYSLSDLLNANTDDYQLNYPSEIKRLMDILSVNQSKLLGSTPKNETYFERPSDDGTYNRGDLLNITSTINAGDNLILKTKSLNKYELVQTGPLPLVNIDNVSKSIDNFIDIINGNPSPNVAPKTKPNGIVNDESYEKASDAILLNKINIQKQILDYVYFKYPYVGFTGSLSAKFFRDIGYIVDAIAADIANNTNHRSIEVSNIYFTAPTDLSPEDILFSSVPTIPAIEVYPTIDGITQIGSYITGQNIPNLLPSFTSSGVLSSTNVGSSRVNDVNNLINAITYTLNNNGKLLPYNPPGNPNLLDKQNAKIINQNKTSIQQKVSSYVFQNNYISNTLLNPVSATYYRNKCTRDVGLMVDAICNDLATGVNARSIQYALTYWDGSTSRLPQNLLPNQISNTISTIRYLGSVINEYVTQPKNLSYTYTINDLVSTLKFLPQGWQDYYDFYSYISSDDNKKYTDNLIDWNNPQTTLSNKLTSIQQWIGDEQSIDTIFSYNLYTGLGIF